MGATDRTGRIVLAACALPGVLAATPARAEDPPAAPVIEFRLSGYRDYQDLGSVPAANGSVSDQGTQATAAAAGHATVSGASGGGGSGGGGGGGGLNLGANLRPRVSVTSPSVSLLTPLDHDWSLAGTATVDQVSGASPSYYTDPNGFAHFHDRRRGADATLTRYFDRQSLSLGAAVSHESDYVSNALSLSGRWATPGQDTTFNAGIGLTRDRIDPTNHVVVGARKRTNEWQVGVTQALSQADLVQLGYTRSQQTGYLDDPYKLWDHRPGTRDANVLTLRWNHWMDGAALKTSYRWYGDSWGVVSHTLEADLAIPFGDDGASSFTPSLRWYSQGAARFYVPYDGTRPGYPQPIDTSGFTSLDQRVSAYGAITGGLALHAAMDAHWSSDFRVDVYRQEAGLRLLGTGSGGLSPLTAVFWQVGVKYAF